MNIKLKIFLSLVLLINLILIIKYLKLKKITLKYSVFWIILLLFLEISVFVPNIYFLLSDFFGFEKASNMVFLLAFFLLLYLNFILITSISGLNDKVKNLIQEVSILKERVDNNERN